MRKMLLATASLIGLTGTPAFAGMPAPLLIADAQAAIAAASKAIPNEIETVWVVDKAGDPLAMLHPACAPTLGIPGALGKAVISAWSGQSSSAFDPRVTPAAANNMTIAAMVSEHASGWKTFVPSQGAEPIKRLDNEGNPVTIGAVGCGGGTPDQDETCAQMGVAAVKGAQLHVTDTVRQKGGHRG